MSLDKAIDTGKEKRKPYYGSKRFDRTCRNNGSCPWCEGNRTIISKKQKLFAKDDLKNFNEEN